MSALKSRIFGKEEKRNKKQQWSFASSYRKNGVQTGTSNFCTIIHPKNRTRKGGKEEQEERLVYVFLSISDTPQGRIEKKKEKTKKKSKPLPLFM